jgi:hypothetical protein
MRSDEGMAENMRVYQTLKFIHANGSWFYRRYDVTNPTGQGLRAGQGVRAFFAADRIIHVEEKRYIKNRTGSLLDPVDKDFGQ